MYKLQTNCTINYFLFIFNAPYIYRKIWYDKKSKQGLNLFIAFASASFV